MNQHTISQPVSTRGAGVNSGKAVTLTLLPAPPHHGIVFRRVDLPDRPEIKASVLAVTDLVRKTALAVGPAEVQLVEHVLSAIHGCAIDNVTIEMDAPEAPIMDGSARPFVELLHRGGIVEQAAVREFFSLDTPITVTRGNASLVALPAADFEVTYTALDDRMLRHAQHRSFRLDPEAYAKEIAPARTYVLHADAEAMRAAGGIRGGSLDNCIVVRGEEIMCTEPLRFPDEFVRHKILDLIGDIILLGVPLKAHIIALRAGHALHADLTRALAERWRQQRPVSA